MSNGRDNDTSTRRGGGSPGVPGPVAPDSPPKTTDPKSPPEPGRVARNETNPLDLPITRMKLGWSNGTPAALTRFRLWLPTDTGGVLTLQHTNGTVELRRPLKTVIQPAAKKITYFVKTGEFGEYFIISKGTKENEIVNCTFTQTSFSHDGEGDADPPLIPWNFWYWPSAKDSMHAQRAADVMAKFGKAFGYNPDSCRNIEVRDHWTQAPPGGGADWQGHCHNAAPASALFVEPANVNINGEDFSEEEMKYLAAEYFGNYGQFEPNVWELKAGPTKPGGDDGRFYLPAYFKPGEPMNRDAFEKALKYEFREAGQDLDDDDLAKRVRSIADTFINPVGEAGFEKQMKEWMGQLAASFYQALIDAMRVKKHPLMANMRSYNDTGGPEEVWNQAYFWYQASYSESDYFDRGGFKGGRDNDTDIIINCDLRANRDYFNYGMPNGLPAKISGYDITPDDSNSLIFKMRWRIIFHDDTAKIVVNDPRNEWVFLRGASGQSLYAPTKLLPLAKLSNSRNTGGALMLGNAWVRKELIQGGWLKVHKRYQ